MKFSIVKSDFIKPLSHIYSVVEKRNTIPILSNVVIEASENTIAFTATDMEIDLVEQIPASVVSHGKITVSAHTLYDIVRKFPDGSEIILNLLDNNLIVSCGKSEFVLPTLPFDDYPIMSNISGGISFLISSLDLQNLIDNTKFAISLEETRYYLNGIYLHEASSDTQVIRAVATDGHRLAQAEIKLPENAKGMSSIIIPRKTVGEVRKLLEDTEGNIKITVSNNKIKFEITNKAKNKNESPVAPLNWVYDQARPKVEHANNARTNKSALIILYQGWASADTSTLKKNQNQYPPTQVNIAPICHNIDHTVDEDLPTPV